MSQEIKSLLEQGYAIVSRRHRIAARIDRPDWKEYMAKQHCPWDEKEGLGWVKSLGYQAAADYYRRVYSKDTLQIDFKSLQRFPPSDIGPTHFKAK